MAATVTHSLVQQFASMKPTEFGPTIEPKWQVGERLLKEVKGSVEKGNLTPLDGARVISSITATLFGYVVNGEGGVLLLPLCTLLVRSRRGRVAGVRSGRLGGRPPASRPSRRLAAPLSMSLSRRRCASSTSISTPDALTLGAPPSASSITPTVALRSSPRSRSSCRRRLRRSRSSVGASCSTSPGRTQRHWASTGRRPNRQSRRHTLPPHCPISGGAW